MRHFIRSSLEATGENLVDISELEVFHLGFQSIHKLLTEIEPN